jgi:hypothetical protein
VTEHLEDQINRLDNEIAAAERAAAGLLGRVRGLRKRIAGGDIAQLSTQLDQAAGLLEPVGAALAATQGSIDYDVGAALADGSYLDELKAEAAAQGVVLTERDGRLTAFPVLLRLQAAQAALRIGGKMERRLRPSVVVRELRRRQATEAFNAPAFLGMLFRAYAWAAPRSDPGWRAERIGDGPVVALADILALLTLGETEYSAEAFAVDLLRLDRAPDTRTRGGHRFALPASTGTKGRGRIGVYDEAGIEHVYFGIRFSRDAGG